MTPILLSREDLKARGIRYSRAQLWRKVKDGSFPQPVRLGENRGRLAFPRNRRLDRSDRGCPDFGGCVSNVLQKRKRRGR
jgi:predicted DNA-binding transcriptional regulator AlpA